MLGSNKIRDLLEDIFISLLYSNEVYMSRPRTGQQCRFVVCVVNSGIWCLRLEHRFGQGRLSSECGIVHAGKAGSEFPDAGIGSRPVWKAASSGIKSS